MHAFPFGGAADQPLPCRAGVRGLLQESRGHLASLLALTSAAPRLAGAVIWYGPSDLALSPGPPESLLLGAGPAADPAKARDASPVAHVHRDAPPFLLVHGEGDGLVPCAHSQALAARLREAGASADLSLVPSADHGWHGIPDDKVEAVFTTSLRFALNAMEGGTNTRDPGRSGL
ncbi:prolyl oligopeptidase family serine peptidase [Actinomadura montaniterrae]|uniref:prolyl oligopeptidase family serine peptidase n=1 Tax=Actinomadura montaniterrae TaxID=1803903 RepID=UPI001CEF9BCE|nr:prolyl oligopeptidase family serine peptidase [Actinomadura montaniterrae]